MIASLAVITIFAFDHPAFTAETLITDIAVINRMNCISVAVMAIKAVLSIAISAQFESMTVPDTRLAPDLFLTFLTAIVAPSSFGDAGQANNQVTLSALFRRLAVNTEKFVTGRTVPLSTTIQTVIPVAGPTKVTYAIIILPILFRTTVTVVLHAIIAGDILCSVTKSRRLQH